MRFDAILHHLGEFGTYQKRVYLMVCIPAIFAAFQKLVWVFLGAVPKHRCRLDVDANHSSYLLPDHVLNQSVPWDSVHDQWSTCEVFLNGTADDDDLTGRCDSWVYDTSVYSSTVVTEFGLVCERNWMRAAAYSLYVVGEFIGAIVIGGLSDRLGRRKVLLLCLVGQGLFGILSGLIRNYYAFVLLRLVVGMFTQAGFLTGYILGIEFVGPSKRVFAGVACNYFFALGYVIIAGVAYLIRDWNYLQMTLSIPVLIYCIVLRWLPESARWLLSVNRSREALLIVKKAAKVNKVVLPPEVFKTELIDTKEDVPQATIMDLIQCREIRNIILIMGYMWLVNSAVYYGLSLNTSNLGGNDYLNFLIAAVIEFPAYTVSIFTIGNYGRRYPTTVAMCVGGLGLLATVFVPPDMTTVITILAMVGKFGITVSYSNVFVYAAELYPTQVRNVAVGVNSTFARIGGILTPFIILLADYWRPLPMVVLGAMSASAGFMVLLLPETHKRAMPETLGDIKNLKKVKAYANGSATPSPIKIVVSDADDEVELKPMMNSNSTKH